MIHRQRALSLFLMATMIFTFSLMMFMPAMAVRGSYSGLNGKIVFQALVRTDEERLINQIFVMNPDGTDVRRLTEHPPPPFQVAESDEPVWSPDGSKIAFSYEPLANNVWIMNADGSNWIELTRYAPVFDTGDAAWSPDGSKIAFTERSQHMHVVPAVPAADPWIPPPDLTMGQSPHWSPDGAKILFHRYGIGGFQDGVYVMDADGSGEKLLMTDALDPCWSPDGSKIVFSSGGDIYVMNADGSGLTGPLIVNGEEPNWSPDGSKIAFARVGPGSIWVMNADGSNPIDLTPDMLDAAHPDWQRLPSAVGGIVMPANTFAIAGPWLAVIGLVGCMGILVVVAKMRRP